MMWINVKSINKVTQIIGRINDDSRIFKHQFISLQFSKKPLHKNFEYFYFSNQDVVKS